MPDDLEIKIEIKGNEKVRLNYVFDKLCGYGKIII